jgi:hypothetical protein
VNLTNLLDQAKSAEDAGFVKAAADLRMKAERGRKLAIAYEHFKIVPQEKITSFNEKLKEKTRRPLDSEQAKRLELQKVPHHPTRWEGATVIHDELTLVKMADYPGLPPSEVLGKVKEAKSLNCFDRFEVAEVSPVSTVVKLPDPIVFGLVDGCTDRFFIAEWGQDVKVSDLIGG